MTLWRCLNCGTKFAPGLSMCPQCTSENAVEDGEEGGTMSPKITVNNGPSDARQEGDGWDGNSSSTSTETPSQTGESKTRPDQSPAPTTENPSETGQTESGTARSTDGVNADAAPYDEWKNSDLSDELERRGLPKTGTKAEMVDRLTEDDAYADPNAEDQSQ